jgi:hypothetical protein
MLKFTCLYVAKVDPEQKVTYACPIYVRTDTSSGHCLYSTCLHEQFTSSLHSSAICVCEHNLHTCRSEQSETRVDTSLLHICPFELRVKAGTAKKVVQIAVGP